MQKKIIALAVAGLVSGVAFAQSNVTVYGIADVAYEYSSSKDKKFSGINDGATAGLNTSRIGFKGEEALGNGLKAIFQMEYAAEVDQNQIFSQVRQSYAGLSGKFGTATMGRQYSPSGLWLGNTSANSIASVGASNNMVGQFATMQTGGGSRWNNSFAYQTNDMSGFTVRGIYGFGEAIVPNSGDASTNSSQFGLGVQYANGPIYATVIYQSILDNDAIAVDDGNNAWAVGGSYDFKVVKLFANYVRENEKRALGTTTYAAPVISASGLQTQAATVTYAGQDLTKKFWSLGVGVPISAAGTINAEYAQYKLDTTETTAKGFSVGYVHNLSKRTAVYSTVSRVTNDDNIGANIVRVAGSGSNGENITQFALGMRHFF